MAAEAQPTQQLPGGGFARPAVEEAAVAMHREFVAAMRTLGTFILDTADQVEAEPFNDGAMALKGARCAELDARVKVAAEKFTHARFCTGAVQ